MKWNCKLSVLFLNQLKTILFPLSVFIFYKHKMAKRKRWRASLFTVRLDSRICICGAIWICSCSFLHSSLWPWRTLCASLLKLSSVINLRHPDYCFLAHSDSPNNSIGDCSCRESQQLAFWYGSPPNHTQAGIRGLSSPYAAQTQLAARIRGKACELLDYFPLLATWEQFH